MAEQLITSFLAAGAFGILFNVPKNSLLKCGFVGMLGWFVFVLLVNNRYDAVFATLVAAFFVAFTSELFARIYKTPIIVFSVSGIIPLVPGGLAYDAMRNFVENDYNMAVQLAAKVLMISGAIAMGLVFSEVITQMLRRWKRSTSMHDE